MIQRVCGVFCKWVIISRFRKRALQTRLENGDGSDGSAQSGATFKLYYLAYNQIIAFLIDVSLRNISETNGEL